MVAQGAPAVVEMRRQTSFQGRKPGETEGFQGTEGNWFGGKDEELSYGLLRRTFQWTRPSASWRAEP